MKKCIVVFDPYVSIKIFKDSLPSGVCLVGCILPNDNLEFIFKTRVDVNDFSKLLILSGELEKDYIEVKDKTNEFEVLAYILGSELFNFQYIERLISRLNKFNNTMSSIFRYSKFDMQKALEMHAMNHIKSIMFNKESIVELEEKTSNYQYPIIVRPNQDSMSSFSVKICNCLDDIKNGCNNVLQTVNIAGHLHQNILIQEFLSGDEFVVDTASFQGKHYVSGVFLCKKETKNDVSLFRYQDTVIDDDFKNKLNQFAINVLTALGVHTGFSHLEIIYYKGELFLIEINPRLSGAFGSLNHTNSTK